MRTGQVEIGTANQRVLGILTGGRQRLPPPAEQFRAQLRPQERVAIGDSLAAAIIGGPDKVLPRSCRTGFITVEGFMGRDWTHFDDEFSMFEKDTHVRIMNFRIKAVSS